MDPDGFYAGTPRARATLGWHINQGWDGTVEEVPASDIAETYRPDVIAGVLPHQGAVGVVGSAGLAAARDAVGKRTRSGVPPGARLHVLAIGISDYGVPSQPELDLSYADKDARDLAAALAASFEANLYAAVLPSVLTNGDATHAGIMEELIAIGDAMKMGGGKDTAVIFFSGHGHGYGSNFYMLPHAADPRTPGSLISSAMSIGDFCEHVSAVAEHGRVLVFLDACHAGAATNPARKSLQAALKSVNVSVFTSSRENEVSVECDEWQNGAFTKALLEALRRDPDHDSLVRTSDIAAYLSDRIPQLTDGAQHPEVDLHLEARVFSVTG